MAIDVLVTTDRLAKDPVARSLIEYLQQHSAVLALDDAVLYYDFPTYTDYDNTPYRPDALLVSPNHGVIAIRIAGPRSTENVLQGLDLTLTQFCSLLATRLLKSPSLRRGITSLRFDILPVILALEQDGSAGLPALETAQLITSLTGLADLVVKSRTAPIDGPATSEMRSVIEGAKALSRLQRRIISDPAQHKLAAALAKLEAEITNFDDRQRRVALINVSGPQRIRGLAGSGKTIILAMKAAHLHMTKPDARILVTFWTGSLRSTLQTMITKFYRHYKDDEPDWNAIHIRHAWGTKSVPGVYSEACKRDNHPSLSLDAARAKSPGKAPFDTACRDLLSRPVTAYYDHILIDEGQDLLSGFYELCFALAKGDRDSKSIVYAYDELQNVFNVTMPSPEELFGADSDGEPRISLKRAAQKQSAYASNDMILRRSYRNQCDVLVSAHALGFGIYGPQIVQLLESDEHWKDVGYRVLSGAALKVGTKVRLTRPESNSPVSLVQLDGTSIIETYHAPSRSDEFAWVVSQVQFFLAGGLQPEDLLVIAMNQPWSDLPLVAQGLAAIGVTSHNVTTEKAGQPFWFLDRSLYRRPSRQKATRPLR